MLSLTIEYALRAMTHLAGLDPEAAQNSEAIASETQVPKGYLSKLLRDLVLAKLILGKRGPNGGFVLAKPAAEITVLDVVNAVDPIERFTHCPLGNPAHVKLCPLHARLDRALGMMECEFAQTTLAELIETNKKHAPRSEPRA